MAKDKGLTARYEGPKVSNSEPVESRKVVTDEVPDGSIVEVEQWVSGDKVRAEAALKVEKAKKSDARSTLVDSLERLIAANDV